MPDKTGQYWDSKIGPVPLRYRDQGDSTFDIGPRHTIAMDDDGATPPNVTHIGLAPLGAAEGSAVWQIRKLTYSGNGVRRVLWCDGDAEFNNIWTNHAALSYS